MFLMISAEVSSFVIDEESFHNFTSFVFICFELQIAIYVLTLSLTWKWLFVYNREPRRPSQTKRKTENPLKPTQNPLFPVTCFKNICFYICSISHFTPLNSIKNDFHLCSNTQKLDFRNQQLWDLSANKIYHKTERNLCSFALAWLKSNPFLIVW